MAQSGRAADTYTGHAQRRGDGRRTTARNRVVEDYRHDWSRSARRAPGPAEIPARLHPDPIDPKSPKMPPA